MVTDLEHEPEVDRDDNGACTLQHSQGALDGGAGVAVRMAAAIGEVVAHAHAINSMACRFAVRSEEHTSELQSLMRISYAVFCLKKKKQKHKENKNKT